MIASYTDVMAALKQRTHEARAVSCNKIADQVVPEYRVHLDRGAPSCTGTIAKRWQAAWDAACIALGGDPKEYRS